MTAGALQPGGRPDGPQDRPASGERLWLDGPDAARRIRREPRHLRPHLRSLARTGITILPGASPPDLCDQVVADLDRYLDANAPEVAEHVDDRGRFRVNNLHLGSTAAMAVCLQPTVLELLDHAFGYEAIPYSSLTFLRGTEQMTHRDGPYFATWPESFFFGVWTALEDIHPDSGPLHYYPGGHRVDAPRSEGVLEYGLSVRSACEGSGIDRTLVTDLRKGDTVVWHPELPHGGSPIIDPDRTRRSIVVHYKAGAAPLHGPTEFFGHSPYRESEEVTYVRKDGRWVVDHGFVSLDT